MSCIDGTVGYGGDIVKPHSRHSVLDDGYTKMRKRLGLPRLFGLVEFNLKNF